jgi:hypothetical protein
MHLILSAEERASPGDLPKPDRATHYQALKDGSRSFQKQKFRMSTMELTSGHCAYVHIAQC